MKNAWALMLRSFCTTTTIIIIIVGILAKAFNAAKIAVTSFTGNNLHTNLQTEKERTEEWAKGAKGPGVGCKENTSINT